MSSILDTLVGTLPAKVQPYAKTYAAVIVSGLTVASALLDLPAWVTIALAIANAPVVFAIPNLDPSGEKQDESVQPPEGGDAFVDPARVVIVADKPLPPDVPQGGVWGGG